MLDFLKKTALIVALAAVLTGCGFSGSQEKESEGSNGETVGTVKADYAAEQEKLKNDNDSKIDFSRCFFYDFPEIDSFYELKKVKNEITAERALEIGSGILMEQKLAESKEEAANMLKSEESWNGGMRCYETDDVVINISADGLFKYDDGRLSDYNGHKVRPALTVLGPNEEDFEACYYPEQFGDISYKLADGEMTLKEAADVAERYFASPKYDEVPDGMKSRVWKIEVFRYEDFYEYYIHLHRTYNGISFAPGFMGSFYSEDEYQIHTEGKNAIICDSSGICAFCGYTESEAYERSGEEQKNIIGLEQAVGIMKSRLGAEVSAEIERAGLFYAQFAEKETKDYMFENEYRLCWRFEGKDLTSAVGLIVYIDAVNGNIYLMCPHN